MGRLDSFLLAARERVATGAYVTKGPRLSPNGSLVAALARHPTPILAELKPRSPSEGRLLQASPQAVRDVLEAYRSGGAAALSLLTDSTHFDGDPDLLRQAHATGLATLMKDFVVDDQQVACAAHAGASAILLIERCFDHPQQREALVAAAHRERLEVLLEVHDEADLARAADSRADLLGVNARDLDTLQVDPASALRIVQAAARGGRPVVALSGIADRAAYRAARAAGAQAALVGTHLLRSPDPALALRALQRPLAKVCGVRTAQDLAAATAAGADLVGLVVGSPDSPRNLAPLAAQRLAAQVAADAARAGKAGPRVVLVTRNSDPALQLEWCRLVRPDYLQVHGAPPSADLRHRLASIPTRLLCAVTPGDPAPPHCDGVVVDSTPQGGSGATHAWHAAPAGLSLVAGGLHGGNAAQALAASHAWGADASSGLESAPGVKDPERIRAFVQEVHAA